MASALGVVMFGFKGSHDQHRREGKGKRDIRSSSSRDVDFHYA